MGGARPAELAAESDEEDDETPIAARGDDVLEEGLECNYTDTHSGQTCTVKILKVHYDNQPPYYSIRMPDGNERETVRGRLARQ